MDIKEHVKYWLDTADHDLKAAESMFRTKKYDWCLFIGHLVLEKVLKANYVFKNNNKVPPKIHDLVRLAELSGLIISEEQKEFLDQVTDFNLEVRYPKYRHEFYQLCTREFTKKYFTKIKEFKEWLRFQIRF